MRVTMILADAAQVAEGKLYILGAGWSVTGPAPTPSVVAMKIEVDWNQADTVHHWELYLVDEDGQDVLVETPEGPRPLEVRGEFQVAKAPEIPAGSPLDSSILVNLGPIPLTPGKRFNWRLSIDGVANEDWRVSFYNRPLPEA